MTGQRETLLCSYQYDPLDKVAKCAPLNQEGVQRFYRKNRLATEIQGPAKYSVFEHEAQLLAQQQRQAGRVDCALLATDLQRSVLHSVAVGQHQRLAYSPYGQRSPEGGLISLLGFNGERREPMTGHYLLGNGYRDLKEQAFDQLKVAQRNLSVLKRFVKSKGFDPAEIPAQPAFKAHDEAQAYFSQAMSKLYDGMDLHFLKYPAQRKNAVENARWAVRRSSI